MYKDEHIDMTISKEPLIVQITPHNIINITGESGSGKSTYVKEHYSGPKCIIIDTDDLDHWRHEGLRRWLIHLYKHIPDKVEEFDLLYAGILDFYKKIPEWTVIIDSAQFRNLKDVSLLKGKVIVLRTSAQECYDRCVVRYKKRHPNSSISMVEEYNERKRGIFQWYLGLNNFIDKVLEHKNARKR